MGVITILALLKLAKYFRNCWTFEKNQKKQSKTINSSNSSTLFLLPLAMCGTPQLECGQAMSVAKRVSEEYGCRLGQGLGSSENDLKNDDSTGVADLYYILLMGFAKPAMPQGTSHDIYSVSAQIFFQKNALFGQFLASEASQNKEGWVPPTPLPHLKF